MVIRRLGAVTALLSALILSPAGPAHAEPDPDTTPPTIKNTPLYDGKLIGRDYRFAFMASDDVAVTSIEMLLNGAPNGTVTPNVPGTYVGHVDVSAFTEPADVDLTLVASDAAGNTSESTKRVRVDPMAPTATISPAAGATVNGVVTITASDIPDDVTKVVFRSGNTELGTRTQAPWAVKWDTTVPNAVNSVWITVEDKARNVTGFSTSYKIDNTGPEIWASTNWIPETIGPGVGYMAVSYEDHPEDVARVEWWIDGALRSTTQVMHTYDFGRVSRVADVEVRAYDALGNVSVLTRKVRVDATAPTVTWVTPANGALVRSNTIWSEIKATDSAGIRDVVVTDAFQSSYPVAAAPYRKALWAYDGPSSVTWTVTDRMGNKTVVRRNIIVDTQRPSLTVTKAPANNAKVKGTVYVTASAWDRNGIARVELGINGKIVARDLTAGYAFSINTAKYGKTIKVQLRAFDRAGNVIYTPVRTWKR